MNQSGKHSMFTGVQARHVMSPVVACLREDETIGQAAEFFLRLRINSACVVDPEGKLAGILSEKDLIAAMVSLDCWQKPIGEVMRPHVICYDEETPIQTIYQFLCRVSIRRVVILSGSRPVGTISRATLLRWFRNLVVARGLHADPIEAEKPPRDDPTHCKEHLIETAQVLARLTAGVAERSRDRSDDLLPYLVGEATQIQDLVNDLLAYSGPASQTPTIDAAAMEASAAHDTTD